MLSFFQLTTSQGGRLHRRKFLKREDIFQLTTSQGGRRNGMKNQNEQEVFQLTTSQGGRPYREAKEEGISDLSTHDLTRRSTRKRLPRRLPSRLSTHDLTRRSTRRLSPDGRHHGLSTHDLTRRSTTRQSISSALNVLFQLTTSQGGRQSEEGGNKYYLNLSTHDLTRRSTRLFIRVVCDHVLSTHDLTRRSTASPFLLFFS